MQNVVSTDETQLKSIGEQFYDNFLRLLNYFESNGGDLLWKLMMIAIVFVLAKLLLSAISRFTKHMMSAERYHQTEYQGKRVDTLMTLLRSVARYGIYFIAILIVLGQLGMSNVISNLIVTAGIGSVAIGFGAQSLVKDVVTGLFMMFESQFSVGDYVQIDDNTGTVEATAMRVTYLRTFKGEQVIIPNGSISRITNYSRGDNLAYLKIATPYEQDTAEVMELIQKAAEGYAGAHTELILAAPYVQGIVEFADSAVLIGVGCKVHSMKQWEVERGLRLAIKEAMDEAGVSFPYPHRVVQQSAPAHPLQPTGAAPRPLQGEENVEED